jgi:hypothetical protein
MHRYMLAESAHAYQESSETEFESDSNPVSIHKRIIQTKSAVYP